MIFTSSFPDISIPDNEDIYTNIFSCHHQNTNPALIDAPTGTKITYKDLAASISQLSASLSASLHLQKSDVICIISPNNIQYPIVVHAIVKAGGIVSPVNSGYKRKEILYQVRDSGARFLVVDGGSLEIAVDVARQVGIPMDRVVLFDGGLEGKEGFQTVSGLIRVGRKLKVVVADRDDIRDRPSYLCYSSGTTGLPKGVLTTQLNVIANLQQFLRYNERTYETIPNADVWSAVLPFYHIYGLIVSLHVGFKLGIAVVVFPRFEFKQFLEGLVKYGVTSAHVVPPIVVAMGKHPLVDQYSFPKLRGLNCGAAPLAPEVSRLVEKRIGVRTRQGFGLTETSPLCFMCPLSMSKEHPTSCGLLLASMRAKIVDVETGLELSVGREGELLVQGPNVMKGYHNNSKATSDTIDKNGWLRTGDIAKVDDNGLFYIVDRLKELIKCKGFQVAPAELEGLLLEHEAIADAAVIGVPDERAGEVPRAFIVLKADSNSACTATDIEQFVSERVADHKRLRGGVAFVSAIPKSPSGKILRRVLRSQHGGAVMAKL
ncbi:UNVERIFIED_CONTAM: hypothetical protein HDU68_008753 [Siphonaria sp. JEL0065]|nr:hypothetical protein HDU68_008753 [Siphonaria sp. JEL0065]